MKVGEIMAVGQTIFNQILMMFVMMGIGFGLKGKRWLSEQGTQEMANVLLKVCSPCIMITSFNIAFDQEKLGMLGLTFLISCLTILLAIIVACICFRKSMCIERFATSFSNAGFIGIPIVSSILGVQAVFYLTAFLLAFNLFAWTIGVYMMSGRRDLMTLKAVVMSPAVIGLCGGLLLFFSPVKLPTPIYNALYSVGSMNTPLGMMILGTYIANCKLKDIFTSKRAYQISFYRLVLIPGLTFLGLSLLPGSMLEMKMVILIAASAPVGVMVAMFAQQHVGDFAYGARVVSLSTILCLVTIPLYMMLATQLWS